MRDFFYGALALVIAWAVFDQWRRNKDTVNMVFACLVIGAVVMVILVMVWEEVTTGKVFIKLK